MQLKDKVAIVTGAASGIGKKIAEKFSQEGAIVVIADINQEAAEKAVADIAQTSKNARLIPLKMDVTKENDVDQGVQHIMTQVGAIDILVSNAGTQHIEAIDTLSLSNWRKILAIHLDGAFLSTRACLRSMYTSGRGGSIIYIGSCHSRAASPLKAPYVTAKHGLLGLCKVVAKEGAVHHVRANVICPGYVDTPLVRQQIPAQAKALGIPEEEVIQKVMLKDTVDGEFTTTDDIANVALFFAAFADNALTGQSIAVSHGWCMA